MKLEVWVERCRNLPHAGVDEKVMSIEPPGDGWSVVSARVLKDIHSVISEVEVIVVREAVE